LDSCVNALCESGDKRRRATTHLQATYQLLGIPQTITNAVKRMFGNIDMIPEFSYLILFDILNGEVPDTFDTKY
jgi:hypothetical protein